MGDALRGGAGRECEGTVAMLPDIAGTRDGALGRADTAETKRLGGATTLGVPAGATDDALVDRKVELGDASLGLLDASRVGCDGATMLPVSKPG